LLLGPSVFPNSFSNFDSLFFGPRSDSKGVFTLWIEYPLGSGQVLPQGKVGDLMQQVYKAAKAKYEELERRPQVPIPKQSHLKKKPGYGTDQAQEKRTRHNTPNSWKDIVALVETRGLRASAVGLGVLGLVCVLGVLGSVGFVGLVSGGLCGLGVLRVGLVSGGLGEWWAW